MRYTSRLCQADAGQILMQLIHPSVFALLEMVTPLAPPESTAQTDDMLTSIFRGKRGHILFRNDGIRILIEAFYGERHVLRAALRDRQLDATEAGSPLTFFPNHDPACNRLPAPGFLAAELSIYSWDPKTYLGGLEVNGTIGHFVADPDAYIWKQFDPKTFFPLWEQVFFIRRAPWQAALPMSGVATFFVKQSAIFLKNAGYHRIDAVPSWFNVARFLSKLGYKFTYGEHQLTYQAIERGLKRFGSLDASQQSWLVALQNVPDAYIPPQLKLPVRWPVTHTNSYWARMHIDLNPFPEPDWTHGPLLKRICELRLQDAEAIEPALHGGYPCPCMDTLGASSPAQTGPAATDTVQPIMPAPNEMPPAEDASALPAPGEKAE